ncbi:hypothetical protein HMPREF0378_0032 [Eubacterium nodatum ATCC 33099]|nr:hypothetical protein HMPREF0378_0032 [Eubacterium nodatum ATCC 33099]
MNSKHFRALTSSGFVRKTEGLLEYIVSSPGFPKLRFEFLNATILFAERYHFVTTANESFFAVSFALATPVGKCVILDAELLRSCLDADFIGQFKSLQFEFLIVFHVSTFPDDILSSFCGFNDCI